MRKNRALPIAVLLTSATLALAACSSTSSESSSGGTSSSSGSSSARGSTGAASASNATSSAVGPTTKVTMLTDITFSGAHTAFFAGKAEGFFKKNGIDLDIVAGSGSADSASKVAAGAAQFAVVDTAAVLQVISKGAPLEMVMDVEQKNAGGLCTIDSRHKITSYADIKGLSIGASTGDAYLVPLPYLMKQAGVSPDYKFVPVTPETRVPSLLTNKVDAIACGHHGLPSYLAAAEKAGLKMDNFSYAEHGFNAIGWSVVTTSNTVKTNPDLVQHFVNAMAESLNFSIQNPDAAIADFVKANPEETTQKAAPEWKGEIPLIQASNGKNYVYQTDRINATINFVEAAYSVKLDPNAVYTNDFINKAS